MVRDNIFLQNTFQSELRRTAKRIRSRETERESVLTKVPQQVLLLLYLIIVTLDFSQPCQRFIKNKLKPTLKINFQDTELNSRVRLEGLILQSKLNKNSSFTQSMEQSVGATDEILTLVKSTVPGFHPSFKSRGCEE